MTPLLSEIRAMRVDGSRAEQVAFDRFKERLYKDVKETEHALLARLHKHDPRTLRHQVMVARDTEWLAEQLGYPERVVADLRVAALLHDVGKVDIHHVLLHLDRTDEKEIYQQLHGKEPPKDNLAKYFTLRDVVEHAARKARTAREARSIYDDTVTWLQHRGLQRFLDEPAYAYLQHHQAATERLLRQAGIREEVVRYAAAHHPDYFGIGHTHPKECRIIEVADKYNALVQSEGVRTYFRPRSRSEAFAIILDVLRKEFSGFGTSFQRRALAKLVARYLPEELAERTLPDVHRLIETLEQNWQRHPEDDFTKEREVIAEQIVAILAVCNEFSDVLDSRLIKRLEEYKERLEQMHEHVLHDMRAA